MELTIEKIVAGGHGLARIGEKEGDEVVLVPHVAPGDRVIVELDRSRRPARGRVLKLLEGAACRVTPACAIVDRCGGCDLMHLSLESQRDARLSIVREALPPSSRELPIAYATAHDGAARGGRTRARWHAKSFGGDGARERGNRKSERRENTRGRVVLGYRAPMSATIVPVDTCVSLDPRLDRALLDARAMLSSAKGEGEVHAALGAGGLPVLAIEWRGELAPSAYREAEARVAGGRLAGVEISIEGARVPATIGDPRPRLLAPDGVPFVSPPRGFAQASEVGNASLVSVVVARAAASGKRVVELFAGSGNFTVALAREAESVVAIELVPAACRALRENVAARGLGAKVKVVEADAEAAPIAAPVDVVVLDPPRAGAPAAIAEIARAKAKRVIYVSCDPPTLGRDLHALLAAGYAIESIDAIDMFPETSHVELVVALCRAHRLPKASGA